MSKLRWILILVILAALLVVGLIPAAASSPVTDGGYLEYIPTVVDESTAGGNSFMNFTEDATWYGVLSGTGTDAGKVIIHTSGAWSYK